MLIFLLLNTFITAQLQDTAFANITLYYNVNYEWDAQEGDTLLFTTKIPMYKREEYRIRIVGDGRYLRVMGKKFEKYPVDEWFIGISNTNNKRHICRWWKPDYCEIQIAIIAMHEGTRVFSVFFDKWGF